MSDFKFPCPKCGQSILCDTSNAGMNVACPSCAATITVPKAPEPAAVPGKLSIRHSPPAAPSPGAANAPKPASWGAKPAAPPPKPKVAWVKPVGITAAVLLVLAIAWFAVGAPMLKEREEAEKRKQEEIAAQAKAQAEAAAAAEAARIAKAKIVWTLDSEKAQVPDSPAGGKIHGVNFKVEFVQYQNGLLTLRQDSGSSRQFVIAVPVKSGEPIAGKSFAFAPNDTNRPPSIAMYWKDESGKWAAPLKTNKDYLMNLEFQEADNGNVPGGIYLCLSDDEKSFVAGTFLITPKLLPGQKSPPRTAPPAPRKRKG